MISRVSIHHMKTSEKLNSSLSGFLRYRKPESFAVGTHSPNPVTSPFG
jgi:hypothetical protein